ncbi:MAG TPA: L-lactate permease [Clostridia bacterium]|nr:L-lactate permease [Clostridia bacterium]
MAQEIPLNLLTWCLALLPILLVLTLMIVFKWSGTRAGSLAWVLTMLIAFTAFKADQKVLAFANVKGILMTTFALYIIWGALFLYHVVNHVGGVRLIGETLARNVRDKTLQLVLAGICFPTFLQAVAGFGVPTAVAAPLLMALGFGAATSVTIATLGHIWSITFGSMAASYVVLQLAADLSPVPLAPWTAIYTGIACILCSYMAIHAWGGWQKVSSGFLKTIIPILAMVIVQGIFAMAGYYTIAVLTGSIVGMVIVFVLSKLLNNNGVNALPDLKGGTDTAAGPQKGKQLTVPLAFLPYVYLISLVILVGFIPGFEAALQSLVKLELSFPAYKTGYGWFTEATIYGKTTLLGHPGSYVAIAGLLGIITYIISGHMKLKETKDIWTKLVKSAVPSSTATTAMVMMALVMLESGMTQTLARGVVNATGGAYPLFAPVVGVLGGFITGSNVNSNVMFGAFQRQIAELLGLSIYIAGAAQTIGGSIGSVISPAKLILSASTVGLVGREGQIVKKLLTYCLIVTLMLGALNLVLTRLF